MNFLSENKDIEQMQRSTRLFLFSFSIKLRVSLLYTLFATLYQSADKTDKNLRRFKQSIITTP